MGRSESVSAPSVRYALSLAVCLLVLSFSACAQAPEPGLTRVQTVAGGPPAFELRTLERSAGECGAGQGLCARFLARYPVITGGVRLPVRDGLNGSLVRLVARGSRIDCAESVAVPETLEAAAAEFLDLWRAAVAELPREAMGPAAWSDERRMDVIYADPRVLSVELALFSYTAGAHPSSFTALASYDLATGEPIELADLLAPGAEARLAELGERAFRSARQVGADVTLEAAGFWFEDDRFELNDNFAVTGGGLTFLYNPYEVAPHVMGPTRITLPWSAVAGLLRPEALVVPAAGVPSPRA